MGYSPQGHRDSDTTEPLTHTHVMMTFRNRMKGGERPERYVANVSRDFFWDGEAIGDFSFFFLFHFSVLSQLSKMSTHDLKHYIRVAPYP